MAALVVGAALLDVLWWVPAHRVEEPRRARAAQVQTELPQCKRARLQAEIDRLQAEIDALP